MMIFLLPNDVVKIILDFSTTLFNKKNIGMVCKNWKKLEKEIYVVKKETNLKNKIRMLLEEKESNLEKNYEEIAIEWEKVNGHKWLIQHKKDKDLFVEGEKTPIFYPGDIVDVKDRIGVWGAAKVIDIELLTPEMQFIRRHNCRRRYKVKFLGWSKNYDEWVLPCKVKPLGTYTLNPLNKIGTLNKNCGKDIKIWLLVKKENGWEMLSVKKTFKKPRVIRLNPPSPRIFDENPIPSSLSNDSNSSSDSNLSSNSNLTSNSNSSNNSDLSNNEPLSISLNLPVIEPNITFTINETEVYDIETFINNVNEEELTDISLNNSNDITNNSNVINNNNNSSSNSKEKEEKFIDLDTCTGRILVKKKDLNNSIVNPTNASSFLLITSRYKPLYRELNL